jgi:acetyl esterase/lipase
VVVLIFGGAFVIGTNIQSIVWARAIASLYGATAVQPSYRLAQIPGRPERYMGQCAVDTCERVCG